MQIAYGSDKGRVRSMNEDYVSSFWNRSQQPLMLICDGMGGHLAGDVASEMAVSHMGEAWKHTSFKTAEVVSSWLVETIQEVNGRIFQKSLDFSDLDGMGTTLVAATIVAGELIVANVGDSRGYLYRNFQLKQLTEDHSLVYELVKSGELTLDEARNHPQKNYVTRSMGNRSTVQVDLTSVLLKEGDIVLLCSDGLSNMVEEDQLIKSLKSWMSIEEKVIQLIELANQAGGKDNISVLLASYSTGKEVTS